MTQPKWFRVEIRRSDSDETVGYFYTEAYEAEGGPGSACATAWDLVGGAGCGYEPFDIVEAAPPLSDGSNRELLLEEENDRLSDQLDAFLSLARALEPA